MYILKDKILRKFSSIRNDKDKLSVVSDICLDLLELVFPNRKFKIEIVLDDKIGIVSGNLF